MPGYKNSDTTGWDRDAVRGQEESPAPVRRKRRKKKHINPIIYLLFVVVISTLCAGIGWLLASDLCAFNRDYMTRSITVSADDNLKSVSEKLSDAGLIRYEWLFRLFATVSHADNKIGMGTYELNTDMDYHALIVAMHNSSGSLNEDTVRVTIPEGYTVQQIIALLAKNGVNTEESLLEAAKTAKFDYSFIDNTTEDITRLEGYLFPDTYDFYVDEKPASALNRLIKNFNNKIDDDMLEAAESRGYSLKQIVTIASLIEKETDGSDHGKIASVIFNRLDGEGSKGGTYGYLQIDAALLYGLENHQGQITASDLDKDTPYNLRLHAGLPPTAIANPGLKSLNAALSPDKTDFYYYALGIDGKHHFFKTFEEHTAFVSSNQYGG